MVIGGSPVPLRYVVALSSPPRAGCIPSIVPEFITYNTCSLLHNYWWSVAAFMMPTHDAFLFLYDIYDALIILWNVVAQ